MTSTWPPTTCVGPCRSWQTAGARLGHPLAHVTRGARKTGFTRRTPLPSCPSGTAPPTAARTRASGTTGGVAFQSISPRIRAGMREPSINRQPALSASATAEGVKVLLVIAAHSLHP